MSHDTRQQIPSVSDVLLRLQDMVITAGHTTVVTAIRQILDEVRANVRLGSTAPTTEEIAASVRTEVWSTGGLTSIRGVINATGVIIHTNLGRAVMSNSAQVAVIEAAGNYSALEYDISTGKRGIRGGDTEKLLCQLTEAQAALVVNNCAAASVLMLAATSPGKGVIVSRGQLVEIGGGFRIPEILEQSGAHLIEVGTTNRTSTSDYARAIRHNEGIGAILHVHSSNFRQIGFVDSVSVADLVVLASSVNSGAPIPVLDDVGSGALVDTALYGLTHEPMPIESVRAGASLVAFSGDKLLGGPQAGILIGTESMIVRCRAHPLARAFRADKMTLAALHSTLLHYARGEAEQEVPVLRMLNTSVDEIRQRAQNVARQLEPLFHRHAIKCGLFDGYSTVGGGSLPGETLPTVLLALECEKPDDLANALRKCVPPIVARIRDHRVLLDLRTVLSDDQLLASINTLVMGT